MLLYVILKVTVPLTTQNLSNTILNFGESFNFKKTQTEKSKGQSAQHAQASELKKHQGSLKNLFWVSRDP